MALERAKELDRYYEEHHTTVGPLHGLPVSMKDQWHIKGLDTSMVYTGWIGTLKAIREPAKRKTSKAS